MEVRRNYAKSFGEHPSRIAQAQTGGAKCLLRNDSSQSRIRGQQAGNAPSRLRQRWRVVRCYGCEFLLALHLRVPSHINMSAGSRGRRHSHLVQQSQTLSVGSRSSVGVSCQDSTTSFNSRHSLTYRCASPYRPSTEWCFPVHCRRRFRYLFFRSCNTTAPVSITRPPLSSSFASTTIRPPEGGAMSCYALPGRSFLAAVLYVYSRATCSPPSPVSVMSLSHRRCPLSILSVLYPADPGCGEPASRLCFISSALLFVVCMYSTASIVLYVCTLRIAGFASRRPAIYARLTLKLRSTQEYT